MNKRFMKWLICALFFCCIQPVTAEELKPSDLSFEKVLEVKEHTNLDEVVFEYAVVPNTSQVMEEVSSNKTSVYTGIDGAVSVDTIVFDELNPSNATTHVEKGQINVDESKFNRPGIYKYQLVEKDPNITGMHHGVQTYDLDVYIENGEDGKACQGAILVNPETGMKTYRFKSIYKTHNFKVRKKVTGNHGDQSEPFDFTVTIKNEDSVPGFKVFKYSDQEVQDLGLASLNTEFAFSLIDGEYVEIHGVRENDEIEVKEIDANQNGYSTTIENEFTEVLEDDMEMVFVNDRDGITPTGVRVKTGPYVSIMAVAVVAGFITLKKDE